MNIVLFINGNLGLRILNYVTDLKGHEVDSIFVNSNEKRSPDFLEDVVSLLEDKNLDIPVLSWGEVLTKRATYKSKLDHPTLGVSALFGHVLPSELIASFSGGIFNLHPSLLPYGRGADPIPWSIIDRQPQGISIHLIDRTLDTGDLVFQKEIMSRIDMNAGEIYDLATSELFKAFSIHFPKWVSGEIESYPQGATSASFHRSSELNLMRVIDEDELGTFGDFVRRLQATTFSNGMRPCFKDNEGNIWNIDFKISTPHTSV